MLIHIIVLHTLSTNVLSYGNLNEFLNHFSSPKKYFGHFKDISLGENFGIGASATMDEQQMAYDDAKTKNELVKMSEIEHNMAYFFPSDNILEWYSAKDHHRALPDPFSLAAENEKPAFNDNLAFLRHPRVAKFIKRLARPAESDHDAPGRKSKPKENMDKSWPNDSAGKNGEDFKNKDMNNKWDNVDTPEDSNLNDKSMRNGKKDENKKISGKPFDDEWDDDIQQNRPVKSPHNRLPRRRTSRKKPKLLSEVNRDGKNDDQSGKAVSHAKETHGKFQPVKYSVIKSVKKVDPAESGSTIILPDDANYDENYNDGNTANVDKNRNPHGNNSDQNKLLKRIKRRLEYVNCQLINIGLWSFKPMKNCKKKVKSQFMTIRRSRSNAKSK
ncbi:hypothetical protein VCUG_00848 [Vavraia culicis subsp. floridensis]|uniref:FMR1-interacting protein 1 conserved domain-containing protein n=1 Tax=Vavraia culicis (isolate floridensis) TaxID=948595 RepID=L2GWA0_VAVCU|nr:uncharacterized protein VCUG_00848 [Vavraia culicis subsp. floridensis]ELA47647.1 hypothetical protein VCUG_00848 [Vavraia culicis subsp. floridensis]